LGAQDSRVGEAGLGPHEVERAQRQRCEQRYRKPTCPTCARAMRGCVPFDHRNFLPNVRERRSKPPPRFLSDLVGLPQISASEAASKYVHLLQTNLLIVVRLGLAGY
jgi:hypothetical protein